MIKTDAVNFRLIIATLFLVGFPQLGLTKNSLAVNTEDLRPFVSGSYQQIQKKHQNSEFLVVLWSLDCPPCMTELKHLGELHQQYPEFKLVLIATDNRDRNDELQRALTLYGLASVESWGFADNYIEKLRFEIDNSWYGDLPRSYFFAPQQRVIRLRGALAKEKLHTLFKRNSDKNMAAVNGNEPN